MVATYHPLLKSLSKIISKNLHLLYMDDEVKRVFTPGPMISFRSSRKLSSYLVRAKLYPTERVVRSFKCSKPRCLVCVNVTETNTFSSTVTGKTYKTNQSLIVTKIVWYTFLRVSTVVFSMLDKLLLTFVTDGIIIKITAENTHVIKTACKNICMITICLVIMIFLIWSQ